MTTPAAETVTAAVDATDYDHYVADPDGSMLPQSSSITSITSMLEWLDVRPGQRILELGTGSGYTTALLSRLVGPHGTVCSVEVFADLVPRATGRLRAVGIENATVTHADGYAGRPDDAPFDRIVAWATPHLIPRTWIDQTATDAVIVAPVKVAELAFANAICRIDIHDRHARTIDVRPGGYIEMHPDPITDFALPRRYVDASHLEDNAAPWWISSARLREQPGTAERALRDLRQHATVSDGLLSADENLADLAGWLLAVHPDQTAIAGLSDRFVGYGATAGSGASFLTGNQLISTSDEARRHLTVWVEEWRHAGHAGWRDVRAEAVEVKDGWRVRIRL